MANSSLPPLPIYTCRRATSPITVDGVLDEPAWQHAESMHLVETVTGDVTRYPTEVRVLWDDTFLYVGFRAIDPDIWGTYMNRDDPLWDEEVVEVFLDDDCDEWSFLEFEVSPNNVVVDLACFRRGGKSHELFCWDCPDLQTAVQVDGVVNSRTGTDRAWTTEIAIPFDQCMTAPHIPPRHGDRWRANFYRIDRAHDADEYSAWSPTGEIQFHMPNRFGYVIFSEE